MLFVTAKRIDEALSVAFCPGLFLVSFEVLECWSIGLMAIGLISISILQYSIRRTLDQMIRHPRAAKLRWPAARPNPNFKT